MRRLAPREVSIITLSPKLYGTAPRTVGLYSAGRALASVTNLQFSPKFEEIGGAMRIPSLTLVGAAAVLLAACTTTITPTTTPSATPAETSTAQTESTMSSTAAEPASAAPATPAAASTA